MKYLKFIIKNYRAITGPITIDIDKAPLIPIIGINECGKTTILNALFAFDFFNDSLNDKGKHLKDVNNLYNTQIVEPEISADIEISWPEFESALYSVGKSYDLLKSSAFKSYKRFRTKFPTSISIVRNLTTKIYKINGSLFWDGDLNNKLSKEIIRKLPYILYFDDFRDSIEDKLEIKKDSDGTISGWLAILEQLFKQTDKNYSIFKLPSIEERLRKSVLSQVKTYLNKTLTEQWRNFKLDKSDALQISLDYEEEKMATGTIRSYLKLDIIETDIEGKEHFFYIRDRSKGFYWFFNFVMKLEFNPKIVTSKNYNAIYLLDEPGSYLHASAQSKLCEKLNQIAENNRVIYCTHSHYLLNPEVIPLNSIRVAQKDGKGNIKLIPIHEFKGSVIEKRLAFQPIIDALQIKPYVLDISHNNYLITEGIYDYFVFEMMKGAFKINIIPASDAHSIKFLISLMISWQKNYFALWDNDKEGRLAKKAAEEFFSKSDAVPRFHLLPLQNPRSKKTRLEDLLDKSDISQIKKELHLSENSSFEKTIASLFHHPERVKVLTQISENTKNRFQDVFKSFKLN